MCITTIDCEISLRLSFHMQSQKDVSLLVLILNKTYIHRRKDPPIYTINSHSMTWGWFKIFLFPIACLLIFVPFTGNMMSHCLNEYMNFPFMQSAWMATLNMTPYPLVAKYCTIVYHVIPALLMDLFCWTTGKRQRCVLRWQHSKTCNVPLFFLLHITNPAFSFE